jgi:hypothetical protein
MAQGFVDEVVGVECRTKYGSYVRVFPEYVECRALVRDHRDGGVEFSAKPADQVRSLENVADSAADDEGDIQPADLRREAGAAEPVLRLFFENPPGVRLTMRRNVKGLGFAGRPRARGKPRRRLLAKKFIFVRASTLLSPGGQVHQCASSQTREIAVLIEIAKSTNPLLAPFRSACKAV